MMSLNGKCRPFPTNQEMLKFYTLPVIMLNYNYIFSNYTFSFKYYLLYNTWVSLICVNKWSKINDEYLSNGFIKKV